MDPQQLQQLLLVAVVGEKVLATFVLEGQLLVVCTLLEEEGYYFPVELALALVHLDLEAAEVVQQGEALLFVDDPVGVGPVLHQQIRHQEAYLFVLEAARFLNQSE